MTLGQVECDGVVYVQGDEIGRGGFATVYIAWEEGNSSNVVAIKEFDKKRALNSLRETYGSEITDEVHNALIETSIAREKMMLELIKNDSHANIIEVISVQDNFVVTELCKGGTLLSHINDPRASLQPRDYIIQLDEMLLHLAKLGIIHHDINPMNMCFATSDKEVLKLIDFGFAEETEFSNAYRGTRNYMAPEIGTPKQHTNKVDVFSAGKTIENLFLNYQVEEVPEVMLKLIDNMTKVEPNERWSQEQVHEYVQANLVNVQKSFREDNILNLVKMYDGLSIENVNLDDNREDF